VIRGAGLALFGFALAGCAASSGSNGAAEPSRLPTVDRETGYTGIVSGAADSAGWQFGSEGAAYRYRFRQIAPAGSFSFRDRELSFYFRPSTDALHFQVENLTDRPVWIDWDRSTFLVPRDGNTDRVAHASTRWQDRHGALAPTQIPGLQRYGDYMFPMSFLVDPAGKDAQLHRRLLPEDDTAIHYQDAEFGVDLVFNIDERPRTYTFRFKVASVIPN
jgi:hypothetical protein